jgi:hypothetical protein
LRNPVIVTTNNENKKLPRMQMITVKNLPVCVYDTLSPYPTTINIINTDQLPVVMVIAVNQNAS